MARGVLTNAEEVNIPEEQRAEVAHILDQQVRESAHALRSTFYDLMSYLYVIKHHRLWKELGCDSFEQYLAMVDIALSVSQINLGIRVWRTLTEERHVLSKVKEVLQQVAQENRRPEIAEVDVRALPPSKLNDILPAVTRLVKSGQEREAADLVLAARPVSEGGLSRRDLSRRLEEIGQKPPVLRTYACFSGVLNACLIETDDRESLLGHYDFIIEEPAFVKGRPALQEEHARAPSHVQARERWHTFIMSCQRAIMSETLSLDDIAHLGEQFCALLRECSSHCREEEARKE